MPVKCVGPEHLLKIQISPEDADLLVAFKWGVVKDWNCYYVVTGKNRLHRVVATRMVGRTLSRNEYVDHINHDGLDNRRPNLRVVTPEENNWNIRKLKSCTSKYIGVSYFNGRWHARISKNNRTIRIGAYRTEIEAAAAYDSVVRKMRGEQWVRNGF